MMEILFTESAAGSMKAAKELGRYGGLRGDASDVFCFPLGLDIGPVTDVLGDERHDVLRTLFAAYPFGEEAALQMMNTARSNLDAFRKRAAGGEERIRVWYSSEPDEACGWLWFASVLQEMPAHGPVSLVRLPSWDRGHDETVVMHTGFGEVSPDEWASYARFEREAPALLIAGRQFDWTLLVQQNAGLRAVISGKVLSVPDSFYDFLIDRAVQMADDEFHEAMIIGNVLGRTQIGISDAWLSLRINAMIEEGKLAIVKDADDPDAPAYHRILRRMIP